MPPAVARHAVCYVLRAPQNIPRRFGAPFESKGCVPHCGRYALGARSVAGRRRRRRVRRRRVRVRATRVRLRFVVLLVLPLDDLRALRQQCLFVRVPVCSPFAIGVTPGKEEKSQEGRGCLSDLSGSRQHETILQSVIIVDDRCSIEFACLCLSNALNYVQDRIVNMTELLKQ